MKPVPPLPDLDTMWDQIRSDSRELLEHEPAMAGLVATAIMNQPSLETALSYRLAYKLAGPEMSAIALRDVFSNAMYLDPGIGESARVDLVAVMDRDAACKSLLQPLLFFKGYLSLQSARAARTLWQDGRKELALFLQMRISEVFGVDIHPAARLGNGLMIDHATGVVIGETAVVGENVSMLHGVTLGGTGKKDGDRHPKLGNNVLVGTGAAILGNIRIGDGCRIGAGSVVLNDIPPGQTVVGVPARIVGTSGTDNPALSMDHKIDVGESLFWGENI